MAAYPVISLGLKLLIGISGLFLGSKGTFELAFGKNRPSAAISSAYSAKAGCAFLPSAAKCQKIIYWQHLDSGEIGFGEFSIIKPSHGIPELGAFHRIRAVCERMVFAVDGDLGVIGSVPSIKSNASPFGGFSGAGVLAILRDRALSEITSPVVELDVVDVIDLESWAGVNDQPVHKNDLAENSTRSVSRVSQVPSVQFEKREQIIIDQGLAATDFKYCHGAIVAQPVIGRN